MCVCVFYVYPESIKVTYPTHFILLYSTLSVLYMPPLIQCHQYYSFPWKLKHTPRTNVLLTQNVQLRLPH